MAATLAGEMLVHQASPGLLTLHAFSKESISDRHAPLNGKITGHSAEC